MPRTLAERSASLHLDVYGRLFRVLSGGRGDLLLCDDGGAPVWSSNGVHVPTPAEEAWWANLQSMPVPDKSGTLRQSFHDGMSLTVRPLVPGSGERVGWLAVVAAKRS